MLICLFYCATLCALFHLMIFTYACNDCLIHALFQHYKMLYSPKYWDEFENWAKEKYGVDLEQIRQQNYKDFQKKHTPYKRW